MFTVGFQTEIRGGEITNEPSQDTGFVHVPLGSSVKIIDCSINWIGEKSTRVVEHFHFVWIFSDKKHIVDLDPEQEATDDFYNALLSKLRSILTQDPRIFEKDLESKMVNFYYQLLTNISKESKSLFAVTQGDEQIFQEYLDKYKFFLSPYAKNISSQPLLSGSITRKADYCIELDDNYLIYVEIEPPYYKPFIGPKMSNRFSTALNQVKDWKSIIELKQEIKNYEYLVIIGLDDEMSDNERESLTNFNMSQSDIKVVTWDYILDNIVKVMNDLMKIPIR